MKSGNLNFLEPSGPLQACNGTDLPFSLLYLVAAQDGVRTRGKKKRGGEMRPVEAMNAQRGSRGIAPLIP